MDAAMLARMGTVLELEARAMPGSIMNELRELLVAREALLKERTALKNRAKTLTLTLLKKQNSTRLAHIEQHIKAIQNEIMARIAADPDLSARFDIIVSIPGCSAITAFSLLIDMLELGSLEPGQVASLAGLAPIARQSGKWTGRAFIRGGRATVRQTLYMPALVAMRFNPDLKGKYQQLKQAGKPSKVAITAIMRKLLILANALLKANRK